MNDARMIVLPGMGADSRMYSGAWRSLPNAVFVDWPEYRGETTIAAVAERVVQQIGIAHGDLVIGSSLGGIVACEIARVRTLKALVLIGSAVNKEEISSLLAVLHPIADFAPLNFIQSAAGKVPGELAEMFRDVQPDFIRAMCRAIFAWKGLENSSVKLIRIHGKRDRVIPLPPKVDLVLDGGHLIAMTHAAECVLHLRTST
jgi:pimeloyl-ACP methyl ester carboxylesterase